MLVDIGEMVSGGELTEILPLNTQPVNIAARVAQIRDEIATITREKSRVARAATTQRCDAPAEPRGLRIRRNTKGRRPPIRGGTIRRAPIRSIGGLKPCGGCRAPQRSPRSTASGRL